MNYDLIKIKEKYGEKMMHLCRTLFPTLLEKEGLLFKLIESKFAYSKFLYNDIVENHLENKFKNYIYSLIDVENNNSESIKSPKELLGEAGYNLYECKTEEEIQSFKKYYKESEELCTFYDNRLDNHYVFFAVKHNVKEIKRENFINPSRQDYYGTSVISIQFSRGKNNTLSIKNRYNHTVNNPDATFSNNLDNIIPGLTESFEHYYNLNINQNESEDFELSNYVKANDGKYYKYNYEINNIYYCPDNIIIDNFNVRKDWQQEKEKYLIIDYFILDLVNKEIYLYDKKIGDSFIKGLKHISNIEIIKNKEIKCKTIKITFYNHTNCSIKIDEKNNIISYINENLTNIGNYFLSENKTLREIYIPNVTKIENQFLLLNNSIEKIDFPKVTYIGDDFLASNKIVKKVLMPNIIQIKNSFLYKASLLPIIELPNIHEIGDDFLGYNDRIKYINFPKLKKIGNKFMARNELIEKIEFENLEQIGNSFLHWNAKLYEIIIPKVWCIGNYFLERNRNIRNVSFDNLIETGDYFMFYNDLVEKINFPKLKKVGKDFMWHNIALREFSADKLEYIDEGFLYNNKCLAIINIPNIQIIDDDVLINNEALEKLIVPELKIAGNYFLEKNKKLKYLYAPKLENKGSYFIACNKNYKTLDTFNEEPVKCLALKPNKYD